VGRTSDAKDRLIAAAMELMYTRGYHAVGVQEICVQAGVNKGSFYHFFPSKQALVLAVIETYAQDVQQVWHEAMTTSGPVLDRMQQVFEATYEAHRTLVERYGHMLGCPIGNFAVELSGLDELVRQKLWETFNGWTDVIEHMLRETASEGEWSAVEIATTAQTLIAYFEGVLLLAKTRNDPRVVQQLARGAVHLVEAACNGRLKSS
jgi:TetR/AcrR family transcriptional regulator, transcriptional repressor for nem operon